MKKHSAGLLMYRKNPERGTEVFLVHPGGPFYVNKEEGCWDIPKGEIEEGENILEAAKREYIEETGFDLAAKDFIELTPATRPDKIVHTWAFKGDCDPSQLKSNTCFIEWPPRSGKQMEIPEVDRGEFFTIEEAKQKMYKYLVPLVEELEGKV